MSLLMKALEKAAKDRVESDGKQPAGGTATPRDTTTSELTLEPITREPGVVQAEKIDAPVMSARKAAAAPPAAPAAASPRDFANAATVIGAGHRDGGGLGAYAREHPLILFSAFAGLFLVCYGTYVYLQMTSPGLFIKQASRTAPAAPSVPITQAPAAPAADGIVGTSQLPLTTRALLTPVADSEARDKLRESVTPGANAKNPPLPVPVVPAPAIAASHDTIKVTPGGDTAPRVNPVLADAYAALNAGNLDTSQRLYSQTLHDEPRNVDALLGLAAIAAQQGKNTEAVNSYIKVLELDPRNTLAQAGLISILGGSDPQAAETRVKLLIERDPSAYLYFTLGNVYVDQNRWPDAQQAYFQAYHLQPANPDYAYNLAVGLEHVGQAKLALHFYRRAAQLAPAQGRANFSTAVVQERINKLEKAAE